MRHERCMAERYLIAEWHFDLNPIFNRCVTVSTLFPRTARVSRDHSLAYTSRLSETHGVLVVITFRISVCPIRQHTSITFMLQYPLSKGLAFSAMSSAIVCVVPYSAANMHSV